MKQLAIITGDIINSRKDTAALWIGTLKPFFNEIGPSPAQWEIYRGDEFQLRLGCEEVLKAAFRIKALVKQQDGLDVRLGIGLGTESHRGQKLGESNGTAYQRSGSSFESLKAYPHSMRIASGNAAYDRSLNLMLALALDFMDHWSSVSAEAMALALARPEASQQDLAEELGIRQSAVSQRLKRARHDLVAKLLAYYQETFKSNIG